MSSKPKIDSSSLNRKKAIRHDREVKPEVALLGRALKERREKLNLPQTCIAAWLGVSQRTVSYFEEGRARLLRQQLDNLESKFQLLERGESITQTQPLNLFSEDDFISVQQKVLERSINWKDIWLFGVKKLPVFRNAVYQKAWIKNLAAGINYRLIWPLPDSDFALFNSIQNTFSAVAEVVGRIRPEKGKTIGKMCLFGLTIGKPSAAVNAGFDGLRFHFEKHFPNAVEIKPVDLAGDGKADCHTLLQFGWQRSVALYVDRRSVETFAAVLLDGISNDPKGSESGWTFLSPKATSELLAAVTAFERTTNNENMVQ